MDQKNLDIYGSEPIPWSRALAHLERATYSAYWVLYAYCRKRDPRSGVQQFKAHIGTAFQDCATDLLARYSSRRSWRSPYARKTAF